MKPAQLVISVPQVVRYISNLVCGLNAVVARCFLSSLLIFLRFGRSRRCSYTVGFSGGMEFIEQANCVPGMLSHQSMCMQSRDEVHCNHCLTVDRQTGSVGGLAELQCAQRPEGGCLKCMFVRTKRFGYGDVVLVAVGVSWLRAFD